jgi:hypothetical protein
MIALAEATRRELVLEAGGGRSLMAVSSPKAPGTYHRAEHLRVDSPPPGVRIPARWRPELRVAVGQSIE